MPNPDLGQYGGSRLYRYEATVDLVIYADGQDIAWNCARHVATIAEAVEGVERATTSIMDLQYRPTMKEQWTHRRIDSDCVLVIDAAEFEEARRDPRVHALWAEAEKRAEELIARGHCRCHLVINCPNKEGT